VGVQKAQMLNLGRGGGGSACVSGGQGGLETNGFGVTSLNNPKGTPVRPNPKYWGGKN